MRERGLSCDLEGELAKLARAEGNLLMQEYPSGREIGFDDEDFGSFLRQQAGEFDAFLSTLEGLRCVVKLESGDESKAQHSLSRLCLFMQMQLVDSGVLILLSRRLAAHLRARVATWEGSLCYLPVWNYIGKAVKRGLFAVMAVEQNDFMDDL
jgi:hypothetical protein